MMTPPPRPGLVSVIIPFYDTAPAFMDEALASVRLQTYRDWELLLVDDGGSVASRAVAEAAARSDPDRVRRLEHPGRENRGPSAARNLGIQHATGEYVAFLDADDAWLPRKLEEQTAILMPRPTVAMVYGRTTYWHSWKAGCGPEADFDTSLGVPPDRVVDPPGLLVQYLAGAAAVPSASNIMVRRATLLDIGGFEGSFRGIYEDQVFYAKLCLAAPVFVADRCWDRYRQHADSATGRTTGSGERANRRQFLDWLAAYVSDERRREPVVERALARARWTLEHRRLAAALRRGRKAAAHVAQWFRRPDRGPPPLDRK